ncbi:unnamed protein product [Ambrosiozyma monospora]|uniref:Unnamed protein product n=1 Tax=Ambrosiozyma monospora TaxID=43982 RepID=A0A9W6YXX0_AMBMO|nr:unnamed protein product [Ambrosiozyma monospora]
MSSNTEEINTKNVDSQSTSLNQPPSVNDLKTDDNEEDNTNYLLSKIINEPETPEQHSKLENEEEDSNVSVPELSSFDISELPNINANINEGIYPNRSTILEQTEPESTAEQEHDSNTYNDHDNYNENNNSNTDMLNVSSVLPGDSTIQREYVDIPTSVPGTRVSSSYFSSLHDTQASLYSFRLASQGTQGFSMNSWKGSGSRAGSVNCGGNGNRRVSGSLLNGSGEKSRSTSLSFLRHVSGSGNPSTLVQQRMASGATLDELYSPAPENEYDGFAPPIQDGKDSGPYNISVEELVSATKALSILEEEEQDSGIQNSQAGYDTVLIHKNNNVADHDDGLQNLEKSKLVDQHDASQIKITTPTVADIPIGAKETISQSDNVKNDGNELTKSKNSDNEPY